MFPNNKNNYCEKKACRNSTQNIYADSFNPVTSKYQYINNKMQRLILILKTAKQIKCTIYMAIKTSLKQ